MSFLNAKRALHSIIASSSSEKNSLSFASTQPVTVELNDIIWKSSCPSTRLFELVVVITIFFSK